MAELALTAPTTHVPVQAGPPKAPQDRIHNPLAPLVAAELPVVVFPKNRSRKTNGVWPGPGKSNFRAAPLRTAHRSSTSFDTGMYTATRLIISNFSNDRITTSSFCLPKPSASAFCTPTSASRTGRPREAFRDMPHADPGTPAVHLRSGNSRSPPWSVDRPKTLETRWPAQPATQPGPAQPSLA